jgi:hypothetical protein
MRWQSNDYVTITIITFHYSFYWCLINASFEWFFVIVIYTSSCDSDRLSWPLSSAKCQPWSNALCITTRSIPVDATWRWMISQGGYPARGHWPVMPIFVVDTNLLVLCPVYPVPGQVSVPFHLISLPHRASYNGLAGTRNDSHFSKYVPSSKSFFSRHLHPSDPIL